MNIEVITSLSNPKIKTLVLLQSKSALRKDKGLFVVEGKREVCRAIDANFQIEEIYFCPEIIDNQEIITIIKKLKHNTRIFEVSSKAYKKIAYREDSEGIISICKTKELTFDDIKIKENPLILVLESVEKPGNLGAVLRSCDACKADLIIVCDCRTDIYNPNVIRSSTGAIFSQKIVTCSSEEAIIWLKNNGINIYTAQLQDAKPYYDTDMKGGTAIIMGTEDIGLSETWRKVATKHIFIPMLGICDSLNVSVSASILLFEALRQRQK